MAVSYDVLGCSSVVDSSSDEMTALFLVLDFKAEAIVSHTTTWTSVSICFISK